MRIKWPLLLLAICYLFGCTHFSSSNSKFIYKPFFKDTCFTKFANDTLLIVSSSDFAYYPFGRIKDSAALSHSVLKDFTAMEIGHDTLTFGTFDLTLNTNKITVLFNNDPGTSPQVDYFIMKGEINEKSATLANGIRVGMDKKDFFNTFFDFFPDKVITGCNVAVIQCCVDDVNQYYTFKNDILQSIKFK
ncbi:MAG TPA: hypothetical protein VK806_14400 [Bacteroidia bacterium]|jgi:hypothetical protein|nr:hypothetical protein [Bacteroidia bacterium]